MAWMVRARLRALLSGRPWVQTRHDGSLRVRIGAEVIEADSADQLIAIIGRKRDRLAQRLSQQQLSAGYGLADWREPAEGLLGQSPALRRERAIERQLERYDQLLGELIKQEP